MLKHFREECHQYKIGSGCFFIETDLFLSLQNLKQKKCKACPPPQSHTIKDQGRRFRTGEINLEG